MKLQKIPFIRYIIYKMYTSFCDSGLLLRYYFQYFTYDFVELYYIKQRIVWHVTY